MAYLAKARKSELLEICEELDLEANSTDKVVELKSKILNSLLYKEEVKIMLDRIIAVKKLVEEERQEEQRKREEERKERLAREARQHEPELKKLELAKGGLNQINESQDTVDVSPRIQLAQITLKYNEKRNEMGLYLINFERRAEMAKVSKKDWVAYLLAVLPVELSNMLAGEEPNDANNYDFVKNLILKRNKMNSKKLKQCFYKHHKSPEKTWKNYAQELSSYFTERISELKITTFQQLKDLIVMEQLKFRVPAEVREHYLEDWLKFTSPYDLAET